MSTLRREPRSHPKQSSTPRQKPWRLDVDPCDSTGFCPNLRKAKPNQTDRPMGFARNILKRLLPDTWFSSRETKQRGKIRRFLRWLGPVWYSSPLRRIIQSVCFVLFLWQFFWVCWPYNAVPAWQSTQWTPQTIDLPAGRIEIVRDQPYEDPIFVGDAVFVRDDSPESQSSNDGAVVVRCTVVAVEIATSDCLQPPTQTRLIWSCFL